MLGELDHIDGQGPRWRFSAGCAGAALLLPPWGPAAAAVWAMTAAAAGAAGVDAAVAVRYRLGGGDWVFAVITLVFLAGFTLAAATLLRRPGVALPGLPGSLVVALAWLAMQGFTFYDVIAPWTAPFWPLVPMMASAGGRGGWRARCGQAAPPTAGAPPGWPPHRRPGPVPVRDHRGRGARRWRPAIGSGLHRPLHRQRPARQNALPDLVLIPLVTATIGWAAAAATARLRPRLAASVVSMPVTAPGRPVRRAAIQ